MCKTFKVTKENAISSLKGTCGGYCNRTACLNSEAYYYNTATFMYYCRSCALKINPFSGRDAANEPMLLDIQKGDKLRREARERGVMPI